VKNDTKHIYKKSIRVNRRIKYIIENNFREVCQKTGLKKLSYGKIARAFWSTLAEHPKLRARCMKLVCDSLREEACKKNEKGRHGYHERRKKI
jgi:hypothetical protein